MPFIFAAAGATQSGAKGGKSSDTGGDNPNKIAEEQISSKPVALPKRKKPKKFAVREFDYNIEKSR